MAFTRGWDNTTPPGTRDADEIDDIIRELKVDLYERFIAKLFSAMPNNTDEALTIVLPEIKGNVTGKKLIIHGSHFQYDSEDNWSYGNEEGVAGFVENGSARAPLWLPQGVTITKIRWLISTAGSATCTLRLGRTAFDTGLAVTDDLSELTSGTTGARIVDSGTISVAIADGFAYWLAADQSGSGVSLFKIHSVEITYDTPDCRNTI